MMQHENIFQVLMERIFSSLNHAHLLSIGDGAALRAKHHHHHHHDAARFGTGSFHKD